MNISRLKAFKNSFIVFSVFTLSGCIGNPVKHFNGNQTDTAMLYKKNAVTVEALLAQARNASGANQTQGDLFISFESNQSELTPANKQQLIGFALDNKAPLYLACGPGKDVDRFNAIAVGVRRCKRISRFLADQSISMKTILSPRLQPNQVRLYH